MDNLTIVTASTLVETMERTSDPMHFLASLTWVLREFTPRHLRGNFNWHMQARVDCMRGPAFWDIARSKVAPEVERYWRARV